MANLLRIKWSLVLALALGLSFPALANVTTDTSGNVGVDADLDNDPMDDIDTDVGADVDTDVDTLDTTSGTTTPTPTTDIDASDDVVVTPAAAETRTGRPTFLPAGIRLIPSAGAASFATGQRVDLDNFDRGFSAGLYADFGSGAWVFETGILALNVQGSADNGTGNFNVDSWGIPVMGKVNFSGNPRSTVFAKVGALPFQPTGTSNNFDVLAVAGIGAALPLFSNTALSLEATYNRMFNDGGELGAYQGVALLGGLSFGL